MRISWFSVLALVVYSTAANAQLSYGEQVTWPLQTASNTPHDQPVTHGFNTQTAQGGSGFATMTFASTPAPYVYATAKANDAFAGVEGKLWYEMTVTGPALSYVPIQFRGNFDLAIDSFFDGAKVGFGFQSDARGLSKSQSLSFDSQCDGSTIMSRCLASTWADGAPENLSFIDFISERGASNPNLGTGIRGSFSGVLMAPTDADGISRGLVSLYANASTSGFGGGGGTTWAFIDPEFRVDAAYLADHPDAKLLLPSGVGNEVATRPVPEPGAVWLLIGGLAGLLLAVRRRRAVGRR